MCHRFNILTQPKTLAGYFDAIVADGFDESVVTDGRDRFPLIEAAIICQQPASNAPRQLFSMNWGLVPSWLSGSDNGKKYVRKYSTFNARCETAHQKRTFRDAFAQRRCVVPVNRFFEPPNCWFTVEDQPMIALAGLWEPARSGDSGKGTFTILTTEANDLVSSHRTGRKRMPVILSAPEDQSDWLNLSLNHPESFAHLFQPIAASRMRVRIEAPNSQAKRAVNKPSENQRTLFD